MISCTSIATTTIIVLLIAVAVSLLRTHYLQKNFHEQEEKTKLRLAIKEIEQAHTRKELKHALRRLREREEVGKWSDIGKWDDSDKWDDLGKRWERDHKQEEDK